MIRVAYCLALSGWLLQAASVPVAEAGESSPPERRSSDDLDKLLATQGIPSPRDPGNQPVVAANRTRVRLDEAPASITIITREDIQRYGYQSLDQALARVPEVYTHYLGHNVSADFRGFWTNNLERRVLYLLNGNRLNDRFHFGDFFPDVLQDLSNVERIEILRGPGAALYGSVAVLGVVNVVTVSPLDIPQKTQVQGSLSVDEWTPGGGTRRIQAGVQHRWDLTSGWSLNCNWYDGETRYDTRTENLLRPWTGPYATDGPGIANPIRTTDFYTNVPGSFAAGSNFQRGKSAPNLDFRLDFRGFTFGSFLHTRRVSWVWSLNTCTFNHPTTDRSWGTAGAFVEWKSPVTNPWQASAKLSTNLNTNREITDFGADQFLLDSNGLATTQSLFKNRIDGAHAPKFIDDAGGLYGAGYGIDPRLLTDEAARAHGGGGRKNYAGVDKSWGLEFQVNHYVSNLELNFGGNLEVARYCNKQWTSFRDGVFIGWLNTGGITDRGYYYGLWGQAIWEATPTLTWTLGVREDWQVIQDVYRQLGGDQVIHEQVGSTYPELRRRNRRAHDFTPRLAMSWRPSRGHILRLIYSKAFRAVPPQEIIRLPRNFGDAESELTRNWEAIYSIFSPQRWKLSLNVFRLKGNVIYIFNSAGVGFTPGSGWSNMGGSVDVRRTWESGWEAWANLTQYKLKRATDAYDFMLDYKTTGNPPLPNQWLPLDSPERLIKLGASRVISTDTTIALEARYNGPIISLRPVELNPGDPKPTQTGTPNFLQHSTPSSFSVDFHVRQDLKRFGWKGGHLAIGIHNLLDAKVWGVMNMDVQGWDKNTYSKPTQIPGFGRQWTLQVGYLL